MIGNKSGLPGTSRVDPRESSAPEPHKKYKTDSKALEQEEIGFPGVGKDFGYAKKDEKVEKSALNSSATLTQIGDSSLSKNIDKFG